MEINSNQSEKVIGVEEPTGFDRDTGSYCNVNCDTESRTDGPLITPENGVSWEIRCWDGVVKKIPVINFIWGLTRFFFYKYKMNNDAEAWRSIPRPIGSLIELGVMLVVVSKVGAAVSSSPTIVLVGMAILLMLCGNGLGCLLGGGGELLIIFLWEREEYRRQGKAFFTETRIYDSIIKDWMVLGPFYSVGRAAIFAFKRNKEEAINSCKNFARSIVGTVIGVTLLATVGFTHFRAL